MATATPDLAAVRRTVTAMPLLEGKLPIYRICFARSINVCSVHCPLTTTRPVTSIPPHVTFQPAPGGGRRLPTALLGSETRLMTIALFLCISRSMIMSLASTEHAQRHAGTAT